jgi:hypothetical protein
LLADDPFAGLDPDTEAQIAQLLIDVAKSRTLIAALPDPVPSLPLPVALRLSVPSPLAGEGGREAAR